VLGRDRLFSWKLLLTFALLLLSANSAMAYIGPGADLSLVGSFFALLAWVAILLSTLLLWPIHALRRYFRGARTKDQEQGSAAPSSEPDSASE
jgi:hypothetical protein